MPYRVFKNKSNTRIGGPLINKIKGEVTSLIRENQYDFYELEPFEVQEVLLDKIRLLYVGRISAEKGIFNFIKMFDEIKTKFEFSIVGNLKKYKISNNNINLIDYVSDTRKLINIYFRNFILGITYLWNFLLISI